VRARREAVTRAVAGEPRVKVLLVFGVSPIVVAGPGSFPNEMIELANGRNVVETGSAYPTLAVERLIAQKPDVILNASMLGTNEEQGNGIHAEDPGWRELAAVRDGRVVAIRDEAVLRPGPRIGDGLLAIARALHPRVSLP
jgi:iron complex transport system substrate-binding protein